MFNQDPTTSTEEGFLVSSSDGHLYRVTPSTGLYRFSTVFRDLMSFCPEDPSKDQEPIVLDHVTTESLFVLIGWCDCHRDDPDEPKNKDLIETYVINFKAKIDPEVDPWDFQLLSNLEARVFYACINAATYLIIPKFIEVAVDVWIKCAEPRLGKSLERFLLHEKCSPDVEMSPEKDYWCNREEIARLYFDNNLSVHGEPLDDQVD